MLSEIIAICLAVVACAQADQVVPTENGLVRGLQDVTVGQRKTYYSFRGIPFAEPPVGDLRFEAPVPKKNWAGTLDATRDGESCIQGDPAQGAEDCLFINVYTPQLPGSSAKLLPVMVYIFGGGFVGGNSSYEVHGPDHLLEKDVIVITFNYRLGIWGFLSTGDLSAPGNAGLKDQVLALEWVQKNVANFGGDPQQTTIFGQSAGSASVAYHIQSPLSRGLFQKAILQSGVSLSLWAFSRAGPAVAQTVATNLNIATSTTQRLVSGLKSVNYQELQAAANSAMVSHLLGDNPLAGFPFAPVIEPQHSGAFLTQKSHELLGSGNFAKVPILIGFNSLEGTFDLGGILRVFFVQFDIFQSKLTPVDMNIDSYLTRVIVGQSIKTHYFGSNSIMLSNYETMKYIGDDQFVRAIREFVRLVSKHVPTFFYRFSYEGSLWGVTNRTVSGVTHSEELGYIWRTPYIANEQDLVVRERMTTLWTNFAKTGHPTPSTSRLFSGVTWRSSDEFLTYLEIGNNVALQTYPEEKDMKFWDDLYSRYAKPPFDTY